MRSTALLAAMMLCASCAALAQENPAAAPLEGFITRDGARLMLNGREYRAVGVNIPHLHQAYLGTWFHNEQIYGTHDAARKAIIAAVEDAASSGLRFIRFFADPGYPIDRERLYAKDPAAYWQGMDEVFDLCRRHRLRLVPVLGTIPGPYAYYGEKGQSILDPNSKTYEAVRRYITEFVTRYKDDPTVLMWELVNEAMLAADVEMEGRSLLPAGVYPPGAEVRENGTLEDSLTWDMIQRLYKEHTAFIHSLDPNHLVTSGDAAVRLECTSRRETFPNFVFRPDTWREWLANNLAAQPEPLDVFSYHFYGNPDPADASTPMAGMTSLEWMSRLVRATHAANAPVFIGELGTLPHNAADPEGRWLIDCIDRMEQEGVSLMALWVWHFPWQPDLTISSETYPALVQRAAEFNDEYAD